MISLYFRAGCCPMRQSLVVGTMRTAKLFQNGQSQAVRLPKEFRFNGEQVYVQRMGSAVVLLPFDAPWQALFDGVQLFTADFVDPQPRDPQEGDPRGGDAHGD